MLIILSLGVVVVAAQELGAVVEVQASEQVQPVLFLRPIILL